MHIAKEVSIVPYMRVVRQPTGQDVGPRRTADRLVAIGTIELPSRPGKSIDVWRLRQWIAIATQRRTKIVHEDHQNVRSLCALATDDRHEE